MSMFLFANNMLLNIHRNTPERISLNTVLSLYNRNRFIRSAIIAGLAPAQDQRTRALLTGTDRNEFCTSW